MRHVKLRRASTGRWCIEAAHPVFAVPQPHMLDGMACMFFDSLRSAVNSLGLAGYAVMRAPVTKERIICRNGIPVTAKES